jgi:chemotaxis protein CheY-P-specific phosphatase CheC
MVANSVVDAEPHGPEVELLTLGVERAAAMLSDLTGAHVELSIPAAKFGAAWSSGGRFAGLQSPQAIITQAFGGQLQGRAMLCFSASGGITLAQLLSGRSAADFSELDSELSGILLEAGNMVLNGVMGSLANALAVDLFYSLPELQTANRKGEQLAGDVSCEDDILIGDITFRIAGQEIAGTTVAICLAEGRGRFIAAVLETNGACDARLMASSASFPHRFEAAS